MPPAAVANTDSPNRTSARTVSDEEFVFICLILSAIYADHCFEDQGVTAIAPNSALK